MGKEYGNIAVARCQGDTQMFLKLWAQYQRQQQGYHRHIKPAHGEPNQAKEEHHVDIKEGISQGVAADHAQDGDSRHEQRLWRRQDLDQIPNGKQRDKEIKYVGPEIRKNNSVGKVAVFNEQQRPRCQTMNQKSPDQNGGDRIAGYAKGHHGNERATGDSIVC